MILMAAAGMLALPVPAQNGQSSQPDQSGHSTQPAPQKAAPAAKSGRDKKDQAKKSEAEQNPFPTAESEKAQQQAQQDGQQGSAPPAPAPEGEPSAPVPHAKGESAAQANPFPEAESEKAQQQAEQQAQQKQRDSSSSQIKGLSPPPQWGPASGAAPALNASLGKKDTKVGLFYLQSGDYKGAYSRFLEATEVAPGNAEAVWGLAESARRLGRNKVAIQNFELYLSAVPNGPRAKDCRKALKEMGVHQ